MESVINEAAATTIEKFFQNADLADVNFVFQKNGETRNVPANKAILAALSPVFNAMFLGLNKKKGDVEIVDATIEAFKEFLQLFYLRKLTLSMENMNDVVRLADKYDMIDHLQACAASLKNKLSLDNVCWGYQLSVILGNDDLKEFCEKVISGCPLEIFQSHTFHRCSQDVLRHILRMDSMACDEKDIFDACMEWAKFACKQNGLNDKEAANIKNQLGDCFELIRFGAIKYNELATHARPYPELFTPDDCKELFHMADKDFTPNKFKREPRLNPVFQWKDDQRLICALDNTMSDCYEWVQNDRFAYFSMNYPVLLGVIYLHRLQVQNGGPSYPNNITLEIKIIEYSDQSFETSVLKKRMFTKSMSYAAASHSKIEIVPPIFINPKKMYEISWSGSVSGYYYYEPRISKVDMDDSLKIKFHKAPRVSDIRTGLVCRLHFNRL